YKADQTTLKRKINDLKELNKVESDIQKIDQKIEQAADQKSKAEHEAKKNELVELKEKLISSLSEMGEVGLNNHQVRTSRIKELSARNEKISSEIGRLQEIIESKDPVNQLKNKIEDIKAKPKARKVKKWLTKAEKQEIKEIEETIQALEKKESEIKFEESKKDTLYSILSEVIKTIEDMSPQIQKQFVEKLLKSKTIEQRQKLLEQHPEIKQEIEKQSGQENVQEILELVSKVFESSIQGETRSKLSELFKKAASKEIVEIEKTRPDGTKVKEKYNPREMLDQLFKNVKTEFAHKLIKARQTQKVAELLKNSNSLKPQQIQKELQKIVNETIMEQVGENSIKELLKKTNMSEGEVKETLEKIKHGEINLSEMIIKSLSASSSMKNVAYEVHKTQIKLAKEISKVSGKELAQPKNKIFEITSAKQKLDISRERLREKAKTAKGKEKVEIEIQLKELDAIAKNWEVLEKSTKKQNKQSLEQHAEA
ncbi:hypothetical protein BVX93_00075, partial [bacterium B13(2017)]